MVNTTGMWCLMLADGVLVPFFHGNEDKNPLENNQEFDAGEHWTVDIGEEVAKKYGFQGDPEDDSFFLVPKEMAKKAVFIPYGQTVTNNS